MRIAAFSLATLMLCGFATTRPAAAQTVAVTVDAHAAATPFPHFWEQMFGSGRAILALRRSYRDDLKTVHAETGFTYVRFHGIFHDEVGFFSLDQAGKPVYNFSYIDQIYDGLLDAGVKPFVELSFMPKALASDPAALHAFWYKMNVSPPKDYNLWDDMIRQFTQHLVERYGIEEVAQWYFEVWNEPNIDFWVGTPKQPTYFELYDHTARAIKAVSPRLRVGGPSTAQAAWAEDFLAHCKHENVPVDFISSHVYGNDLAKDVFGTDEQIPRDKMVCRAVRKVHDQIAASPFPELPLIFSEYNASYANEPNVTDSTFMGPWMASTIAQCDGLTRFMSYWSFSDVFEEQGVIKTPFYGGFGLLAEDHIRKPAMNVFAALHRLGDRRLAVSSDSALVTRRGDGALVVALWDYAAPDGVNAAVPANVRAAYTPPPVNPGPPKHFELTLAGMPKNAKVTMLRVDEQHGNVITAFDRMGRPAAPSREQIRQLQAAGQACCAGGGTLSRRQARGRRARTRPGRDGDSVRQASRREALGLLAAAALWRPALALSEDAFLDDLMRRGCQFFWDQASPATGQVRDRAVAEGIENRRISSTAATGFGLTALCIADKHGYLPAADVRARVHATLDFHLHTLPHEHGFFFHFNDIETGGRLWKCELSSIDTALLLCGVLTARAHFEGTGMEAEIRAMATELYERVDWPWMLNGGETFSMGWKPESGFLKARWDSYSELMMIYLLAIGSPTHPVAAKTWDAFARPHFNFFGFDYISAKAPIFIHQYTHAWYDFRRKHDRYADYFANSILATRAHKAFCLSLGKPYADGYWGITASDSQAGYQAWGGPPMLGNVDGSVVPSAAAGSLPFLPVDCLRMLVGLRMKYPHAWGRYGFVDAFHPDAQWYDPDVLGIDQGIGVLMAENLRSGFVWDTFARNAEVGRAMSACGFVSS